MVTDASEKKAPAATPKIPFRGLSPYLEDDAAFFFGRDREREIIAANLETARLTLLYGPSGVGKSSVLLAGVAHDLREASRRDAQTGTAEVAVAVCRAWRDDPVAHVAEVVEAAVLELLDPAAAAMPTPKGPLVDVLKTWTERLDGDLLLILDQFEEYLLYQPEGSDKGFGDQLVRIVNRRDLRVNILIAIREDALARLDRFKGRIPGLFENYLRLDHLTWSAGRAAIEEPIAEYNRRVPPEGRVAIGPGLVDAVLKEVGSGHVALDQSGRGEAPDAAGSMDGIEAPFLQMVMRRLWSEDAPSGELRLETLGALGGAQAIVSAQVDEALNALESDDQELAATLFQFLVTKSGTKVCYATDDLADLARRPSDRVERLLERLADGQVRILRPVEPAPGRTESRYEIFHDVLAGAVLDWRRRFQRERDARAAIDQAQAARRRARTYLAVAGTCLALAVVAVVLALWALDERSAKDSQATAARAAEFVAQSREALETDSGVAFTFAERALRERRTSAGLEALRLSAQQPGRRSISTGDSDVRSLAVLSDGRIATGSEDGKLQVWDPGLLNQAPVPVSTGQSGVYSLAVLPDGRIAIGTYNEQLQVWDPAQPAKAPVSIPTGPSAVWALVVLPDGRIATGTNDGELQVWDPAHPDRAPVSIATGNPEVFSLAVLPGGRIATGSSNGRLQVWDLTRADRALVSILTGPSAVRSLAVLPHGRIATGSGNGKLQVWDLARRAQAFALDSTGPSAVWSLAVLRGGRIAAGRDDGQLQVWDPAHPAKAPVSIPTGHSTVFSLAVRRDGSIASGSTDGQLQLWDPVRPGTVSIPTGNSGVFSLGVRPDGRIATGSTDGQLQVWDPAHPAKAPVSIATGRTAVRSLAVLPGGRIATGSFNGRLQVWDPARPARALVSIPTRHGPVLSLGVLPGRRIATGSDDGQLQIWDLAQPAQALVSIPTGTSGVFSLGVLRDGGIATGNHDGQLQVWDPARPAQTTVPIPTGHGAVWSLGVLPDGGIATGSDDGRLQVWDLAHPDQALVSIATKHSAVFSLAVRRDGSIATGSPDGQLQLWDPAHPDRAPVFIPTGHSAVRSLAVLPDGWSIASGSDDGQLQVRGPRAFLTDALAEKVSEAWPLR